MPGTDKKTDIKEAFKRAWAQMVIWIPILSVISKPNFITYHYCWIIGWALLGSIVLFTSGNWNLRYIDCLFLGSGAATQSGLNTVDINQLKLFQQFVLYFVPLVTNPMTVNGFISLWRLRGFQKRFKLVSREEERDGRIFRRTYSIARTTERDIADEERGVDGRPVHVLPETSRLSSVKSEVEIPENVEQQEKEEVFSQMHTRSNSSHGTGETSNGHGSASGAESESIHGEPLRPQITFAEQVKLSDGSPKDLRIPAQRTTDDHIAFLQRQRNREDSTILRIPNPRDVEAGIAPQAVNEIDPATRVISRQDTGFSRRNGDDLADTRTVRRGITIAEPPRPTVSEHIAEEPVAKGALGALRLRRPNFMRRKGSSDSENPLHQTKSRVPTIKSLRSIFTSSKEVEVQPYLSYTATIGRNSRFLGLDEDQRDELGGIEYRSLKLLIFSLTFYFVGLSLSGLIGLLPWIMLSKKYGDVVRSAGTGRVWWAIYASSSAFNDVGFTLTPDSMISFNDATWALLLMGYLIIVGNTGFPIMLRVMLWAFSKVVPTHSQTWHELRFLLDHPRRCFTLLFPNSETWALFGVLVILNGVDLILFIILDLKNPAVTDLPVHIRILNGWFQAVSTRTAGFVVTNLAVLHPAVQVSYLVMMYISVLPIAISVRRTNVYEQQSLGVYDPYQHDQPIVDGEDSSYIGTHLRNQLSFDLWYIFLGFFIIAISEGHRIQGGDPAFSMFSILFEIVSAYGTVGLSLGYTDINASFSAEFGVIGKLVIIAMQIRGRHRGLPYALDKAIMLPGDKQKEEAEAAARARRDSFGAPTVGSRMGRTRSRSSEHGLAFGAANLLTGMLHPGPTIAKSYSTLRRDLSPPIASNPRERRHSLATTGMRARGRDENPRMNSVFNGLSAGAGTADGQPIKKPEGRRHFYQEGVNPQPKVAPEDAGPKNEVKQD